MREPLQCCLDGTHSFSWRQGIGACRYCGEKERAQPMLREETLARARASAHPLGPREEWDEHPLRGAQWPAPAADYEALGYPETKLGRGNLDGASMIANAMRGWIDALTVATSIKKNDDDTDKG